MPDKDSSPSKTCHGGSQPVKPLAPASCGADDSRPSAHTVLRGAGAGPVISAEPDAQAEQPGGTPRKAGDASSQPLGSAKTPRGGASSAPTRRTTAAQSGRPGRSGVWRMMCPTRPGSP